MKIGPDRVAFRMAVVGCAGLAMMSLAACSEEVPTDYTAAHREAFLAACSRPIDDPRLLSDVCGCVYDRIQDELPFDQFQRMSERLVGATASTSAPDSDADAPADTTSVTGQTLPEEIARLVADCFTVEADL